MNTILEAAKSLVEITKTRIEVPSTLPSGYIFLDPDEYDEMAFKLADRFLNIGSDKELELAIGTDDDNPDVVAVLYTGYTKEAFSFDVVVHEQHRRKGLAKILVSAAIDQYEDIRDAFGKDFHMEVDVVNKDMERLLKSIGFMIQKKTSRNSVQMTLELESTGMMTKAQKKQAKRTFNYNTGRQAVMKTGVPSFEEVWKFLKTTDGVRNMIESLADDRVQKDQFEYETDKNAEEHPEEFLEWLLEGPMKEEVENHYDDVVYFVDEEMDGKDCWRAVGFPPGVDPLKHENLGIYWSSEESGADEYWGSNKSDVSCVYRAKIDRRNVDLSGTVYARMDMDTGMLESEVRMIKGAKIFVYDVEVCDKKTRNKCKTIEINEWRHA